MSDWPVADVVAVNTVEVRLAHLKFQLKRLEREVESREAGLRSTEREIEKAREVLTLLIDQKDRKVDTIFSTRMAVLKKAEEIANLEESRYA